MTRNRVAFAVLLALLGSAISGLLLYDHHGVGAAESTVEKLCGAGDASGCEQVSQSSYSTMGRLSVAAIGVFFYASMLLLLGLGLAATDEVRESTAALALVAFGLAFVIDLGLFAIQAFAIHAFCKLCLATYAVNVASIVTLLPAFSKLSEKISRSEALRPVTVWALGSIVLLVGIASVDRALAAASEKEPTALLGAAATTTAPPLPTTTVAPETTTSTASEPAEPDGPDPAPSEPQTSSAGAERAARLERELSDARARVQELQSTLDDPQKFQQYQTAKAQRDFEQEKPQELALDGVPFKGPESAPVRVVEFSDFMCPFCRNLAGAFAGFLPQSEDKVSVYFKNYPLDQACNPIPRTVHQGACELALGGICANAQGKFWAYHDQVFAQEWHQATRDDVLRLGSAAGLDADALRQCLDASATKDRLARDIQEGKRLAVQATPTVYVNGKKLEQLGGFMIAVESELERLGIPVPRPR